MAITSKELARITGVSEATMSIVLNGKPGISDKTRKKVSDRVVALGYGYMFRERAGDGTDKHSEDIKLGAQAGSRGGFTSESFKGRIGYVIYKSSGAFIDTTSFFPLIVDGMESMAARNKYQFLMLNLSSDMEIETKLKYLKESMCDGFIFYAPEMPREEAEALQKANVPFVLLDNDFAGLQINSVTLNNDEGMYLILQYLKSLGHMNVGYLSSGVGIQSFSERRCFFGQHLNDLGLYSQDSFRCTTGYPADRAEMGMDSYLENNPELPTAFVAENDIVAFGAIRSLKKHGYRVPDDISIIGISDRPICLYSDPSITTLRIPRDRFGSEAVSLLIDRVISNPFPDGRSRVKTEVSMDVVVRDSTGPVKNKLQT